MLVLRNLEQLSTKETAAVAGRDSAPWAPWVVARAVSHRATHRASTAPPTAPSTAPSHGAVEIRAQRVVFPWRYGKPGAHHACFCAHRGAGRGAYGVYTPAAPAGPAFVWWNTDRGATGLPRSVRSRPGEMDCVARHTHTATPKVYSHGPEGRRAEKVPSQGPAGSVTQSRQEVADTGRGCPSAATGTHWLQGLSLIQKVMYATGCDPA